MSDPERRLIGRLLYQGTVRNERWPSMAALMRRRKETSVFLSAWIVLGLLAGFIGSKLVNKRGEGIILDIILAIVGAIAGGWLFNMFGPSGVTGFSLYSLLLAVVGAVVVLLVYYAIRRPA